MSKITLTVTVEPELAKRIIDLSMEGRSNLAEFVENNFDPPINPTPAVDAQSNTAYVPPSTATAPAASIAPTTTGVPTVTTQPPATPAANPTPTTAAAPTAPAPTYTLEDLSFAASPLMAQGKQSELVSLLNAFGARALTELQPARYGEFATSLRGLGAQI